MKKFLTEIPDKVYKNILKISKIFLIIVIIFNCIMASYEIYKMSHDPQQYMTCKYISAAQFGKKTNQILVLRPDTGKDYVYTASNYEFLKYKNCNVGDIISITNPRLAENYFPEVYFFLFNIIALFIYASIYMFILFVFKNKYDFDDFDYFEKIIKQS